MLLAFILLCLSSLAFGEDLCGVIGSPTTLTKAKSPYRVLGDLYVTPSARLTLEAGTVLLIVPGEACGDTRQIDWADSNLVSIKVDGALFVTGTPLEPVVIRPEKHQPGKIQWDGIRIHNKRPALVQIENIQLFGAQKALNVERSTFHIANSLLQDNNTGIWLSDEADISIYNCLFTGNRSAAIYLDESNPSIMGNIFYKNPNYAIWSDSRPKPRIEYNLFHQSGDAHCWHCPVGIGKLSQRNHKGDSTDRAFNLYKDPVFMGSSAEAYLMQRDPHISTPAAQAKDSQIQKLYASAQAKSGNGLRAQGVYKPLGYGQWRLSRYSPALDAGPDNDFFQDDNGTRGDLGLFGGKLGRAQARAKR